jgi:starch phosphorylase
MVAVTLLHRQGYFFQRLDSEGRQSEEPANWVVEDFLTDTDVRASVTIENRNVKIRAWRYDVEGAADVTVPVYLLDTDLPENEPQDRVLTCWLYGGDSRYRLCQEVILGMGGLRMLRALGYTALERFHMNEGHASLLTVELLREHREKVGRAEISPADIDAVRRQCVFTTHTPVAAGHDQFPLDLVDRVLGSREACGIHDPICHQGNLNMTYLALTLSHYINGVAKRHGEVSRHLFASYKIDSITNGIHTATWTSPPMAALFDRYVPGWRQDSYSLRYALSIPGEAIWEGHRQAKHELIDYVNRETNGGFDLDTLTIGFARRAAAYKRADLVLQDPTRLKRIAQRAGPLQIVFSGKAHPRDEDGKRLIRRIFQAARELRLDVPVVYLPDYDMNLARLLTAGVDIWLNTPEAPLEASGTSGMKAAANGVPSFSILDGWWIEGCIEGVTGWSIGMPGSSGDRIGDADSLYGKLEHVIVPMFYHQRDRFVEIMRHAIALNGSFFNTQRMVQQYAQKAYLQ